MRFGKRGKLSPRYVSLFEVLERVKEMAYRLALLPSLSSVHQVFHLSLLKGYMFDETYQILYEELELHPDLLYEEEAIQIFDHCSKTLCRKKVSPIKVLWSRCGIEEVILEHEDERG